MQKYPLQGFVVQVNGKEVMLNLGSSQGVSVGSDFEAIMEGKPITYKGKELRSSPEPVGRLEVVRVEPDYCFARIIESQKPLSRDDKVREILPQVALKGSGDAQ